MFLQQSEHWNLLTIGVVQEEEDMEDDDSNSNQNIGFYRLFVLCRRRRIWKMMIPTAIKTLDFTQIICVVQEEEDMEDDDSNSNQNIGFYRLFVLCRRRRIWKMMIPTAIRTLDFTDYLCCVGGGGYGR